MTIRRQNRRTILRLFGAAGLALPLGTLAERRVRAEGGVAKRIIFLYHPDGVVGPSQNGEPSLWHATGNGTSFSLGSLQAPLAPHKDDCVFFRGLSMGGTDSGSHPGGAKKLLTATDYGNAVSIDQVLASTVGAAAPFRHLYLGAHANVNAASGDKHISYVAPGQSVAPEDDPRKAFDLLFGAAPSEPTPTEPTGPDPVKVSVIDGVLAEMNATRAKLGDVEKAKLDIHLDSLREVEKRIKEGTPGGPGGATCDDPTLDTTGVSDATLTDPTFFPDVLRAQMDLTVLAMACGLTKVGVIQASQHTSELIMSRFPNTEMFDPGFDMRSHQASHYGPAHDFQKKELDAFAKQNKWWMQQLAYLLGKLDELPEEDGTMLDHSIVVSVTEVCDGNTHYHDDMPFIVAGGAGGRISTGRLIDTGGRRHADLWIALAQAMGHSIDSFGDASGGALPGLLT